MVPTYATSRGFPCCLLSSDPAGVYNLISVSGLSWHYPAPHFGRPLFEMKEVTDIITFYVIQAEAIRRYVVHQKDRIESERLEPVGTI